MLRCIHIYCGCFIPTAGTDKCPNCDEYPYYKKGEISFSDLSSEALAKEGRTKEEKEGWGKIRRMDKI